MILPTRFRLGLLIDGLRRMNTRERPPHRREGSYKSTTESDQNALDLRRNTSTNAACIPAMSDENAPLAGDRKRMQCHTWHRIGYEIMKPTVDPRPAIPHPMFRALLSEAHCSFPERNCIGVNLVYANTKLILA